MSFARSMHRLHSGHLEEQGDDASHTQDQAIWYDHAEIMEDGVAGVLVGVCGNVLSSA
jgi:hypothetical protein